MARADGILVVSLTHKWFDMIASGEKREEYRAGSSYWAERLLTDQAIQHLEPGEGVVSVHCDHIHQYHTLRAQRAYSGVWLEAPIVAIRWGTPRPEWSGETVTGSCFVIELGRP